MIDSNDALKNFSIEETPLDESERKSKSEFARQLRENPTSSEYCLADLIRDFNEKHKTRFYQQVIILGYIVDFYFPEARLVIEVDGASHKGKEEYDRKRQKHLEAIGIKVLRFTNEEVLASRYYAKWKERYSKHILKKHEDAAQKRFEIINKIKEAIYERVIDWSVA